jgi:uncharacterized protein DUF5666
MDQVKLRLNLSAIFLLAALVGPVSSIAQTRAVWSTANDIRSGARGTIVGTVTDIQANSFTLQPDRDPNGATVRVSTDTIVTRFLGFGATSSEVLSGGTGFARLREGDRVEVRGVGDTRSTVAAEEVLLLGRSVASQGTSTSAPRPGTVEGVVRSIRPEDNRMVIETDRREMLTILGTSSTPVYYEGGTYRMRNIEVGDRVRVDVESTTSAGVRARVIDVVRDATPESTVPGGRTVTSVYGRVTRIDTRTNSFRLEDERGRVVLVDARSAYDRAGNRFRLTDLQVGDRLEISGEFDDLDNLRADTIRFSSEAGRDDPQRPIDDDIEYGDATGYAGVAVSGTVVSPLTSDLIEIRDSTGDRFRILADRDLVVQNKSGGYIRATQLKAGDKVDIRAFRDRNGRYIAQTIRIR